MVERNEGANLISSQNTLVIIPVTGDGKNGKTSLALSTLDDKPLVFHAIDTARQFAENINVCVSSSDINTIKAVSDYGLNVPFKLPRELYTEMLDLDEIVLHAIDHYARKDINFDNIVLLSLRSPFCKAHHILEAAELLEGETEMVAGVENLTQPIGKYYLTENEDGYLQKHSDIPTFDQKTYKYNKAFSILKTSAIRQYPRAFFQRISKYVMSDEASIFIRNMDDIARCEQIFSGKS